MTTDKPTASEKKTLPKTLRRSEFAVWKRLRLAAYVLAVGTVGAGLAYRSAYAGLQDQSIALGRELLHVGDVAREHYRVRINGEPVWVNSVLVASPKKDILDKAEALCRKHSGGMDAEVSELPADFRKSVSGLPESAVMGVFRQESGNEGVVACIVHPNAGGGLKGFVSRVETFKETKDLASLGNARYVYVAEGGKTTRVLTAVTEGSFRLDRFAPDSGEPGGTDIPGAPRPKSAKRLLTAEVDGAAYGVRIYETPETQAAVLAQYDTEMPAHAWEKPANLPGREHEARLFMKDGQDLILLTNVDRGMTYVTLIQSAAKQTQSQAAAKPLSGDAVRLPDSAARRRLPI